MTTLVLPFAWERKNIVLSSSKVVVEEIPAMTEEHLWVSHALWETQRNFNHVLIYLGFWHSTVYWAGKHFEDRVFVLFFLEITIITSIKCAFYYGLYMVEPRAQIVPGLSALRSFIHQ